MDEQVNPILIEQTLNKIRADRPLVHHLTNWVTISECANATRSSGALPVMAHAEEEVEEMAAIASALVLNIGTLTPAMVQNMIRAGRAANRKGIPIVLDAVGAGATKLRSESALRLLEECSINVLKGNAGEIASIAGTKAEVRGVESISVQGKAEDIAAELAGRLGNTVVITGKQDLVSDGKRLFRVSFGHSLMGCVVGTGCMSASVIGSFCAVESDYTLAAAQALTFYGIAGEIGARRSSGPGTFLPHFLDALSNMNKSRLEEAFNSR